MGRGMGRGLGARAAQSPEPSTACQSTRGASHGRLHALAQPEVLADTKATACTRGLGACNVGNEAQGHCFRETSAASTLKVVHVVDGGEGKVCW